MRRGKFPTTMILMALALTACASRDQQAADKAAEAEVAFRQGRNAAALVAIRAALLARDDVSDYWLLMGRISTAANDLPSAFQSYENVIQLDRSNVEALRLLCQLGVSLRVPDKVDGYADKLLLLTPDDPLPVVMKGGAALQRGDTEAAAKFAEQALAKAPQDIGALILKGRILAARNDFTGAARFIEEAPVQGGDDSARLTFLKDLYTRAGDRTRYQLTLKRLAAAKPDDPAAQLDYADMLFQIGRADAANDVIVEQMKRHPDDITLGADIVDVWLTQGADAITPDRIARQSAQVSLEMKSAFARFANEIGCPDLTFAIIPRDLAASESRLARADARAAVAYAAGLQGRRADAIGRLDDILAVDEAHPGALLARARLEALGKNLTNAIADARRVVADDPRNVMARLSLVDFLLARGDAELALAALREGVRNRPDEPRLTSRLATMLRQRGDRSGAIDVMRALVRAAPVSLRAARLRESEDPTAGPTARHHGRAVGRPQALGLAVAAPAGGAFGGAKPG